MGKTSATTVTTTATDPTKVAKSGDTMTGTLTVPTINQDTGTTPDSTSPINVAGSTHHRYATPTALHRYQDVAGWAPSTNPAATGTLKITLPKSWTNTQLAITLRGFSYIAPYEHWTIHLAGYGYATAPSWQNARARIVGDTGFGNKVRFGHDGTKLCILLGDLTTTGWTQYHFIAISEVITGYQNATGWGSGWSIDVITSEAGITNIVDADTSFVIGGTSKPASLALPTGTTPTTGITFGTDTNLYRSAADRLTTDDDILVKGNAVTVGTSTADVAYLILNVSTTAVGGQGLYYQHAGSDKWGIYQPGEDAAALFVRDMVNARQHVTFNPGATSAAASTIFSSNVTVDGDLSVAGRSLGAWTTYTSTLSGTGWAIGDGTITAKYAQIGKTVHFRTSATFGSTSTYGASAAPRLSLPVANAANLTINGKAIVNRAGAVYYMWHANGLTSTTVQPFMTDANGLVSNPTATSPFTWVAGDVLTIVGSYEAA